MDVYNSILEKNTLNHKNIKIFSTFSREGEKQYVQDVIKEQKDLVLQTINTGGTIMICGSLAMQHDVLDVFENMLQDNELITFEAFEKSDQLKTDCY